MLDLVSSFEALRLPSSGGDDISLFSATPIPGFPQHRLGKDPHGAPSLLVNVVDSVRRAWPTPIVLEHLTVQHDVDCRVSQPDGSVERGRFTLLRCTGTDPALHSYFLRIAAALVALLGPEPSDLDVSRAVDRLVELFRSMASAPRKTVQGLWAEVMLMGRLRDPAPLAAAWHALPGDRYDFNAGSQRIEVKGATGRVRQHHFALEQLLPVPGTQVLVASVLVERAGAGTALLDLVSEVRSKISHDPQLLLHVDQVVAEALGDSWRQAQEERFDRPLAENSLLFLESAAIPRVDANLPRGVTDVRFRVDLTGLPPADLGAYRAQGGIFAAALHRLSPNSKST
jgi:hypothetical protein